MVQLALLSMALLPPCITGFVPSHHIHVWSLSVTNPKLTFRHPPSSRPNTKMRSDTSLDTPPKNSSSRSLSFWKDLPLQRRYEHAIFCVYASLGTLLLLLRTMKLFHPILVESAFAITWSSMILSISFLEAWVKFRAPFLRKHVAVDVGRHVFGALNTAELAWSTCFGFLLLRTMSVPKLRQPLRLFPMLAIIVLWMQILVVAPKLYQRAQHQIVTAMSSETLEDKSEQQALADLTQQVKDKPLPDVRWHVVYVGLEVAKLTFLLMFVFRLWTKLS